MIVYWGWLIIAVVMIGALMEFYALWAQKTTLSASIRRWTTAFPLLSFFAGLIIGGLAVHLWG
jgi:hypothetical protein